MPRRAMRGSASPPQTWRQSRRTSEFSLLAYELARYGGHGRAMQGLVAGGACGRMRTGPVDETRDGDLQRALQRIAPRLQAAVRS